MLDGFIDMFSEIEWTPIFIAAVIGAIIPPVFKWLFSLFRKRQEKYHLSLYPGGSQTYRSTTDGDINVRIRYKEKDYDGTLSMLELSLVNDGLNDISFANHFDKPILIHSSSYSIIDAKYIGEAKIKANVVLDSGGTVQIAWGLLKKGESLDLRLTGEKKDLDGSKKNSCSFYDSLSFNVRSDCVDYIAPHRTPFKFFALGITLLTILFGAIHYWTSNKKDHVADVYTFCYNGNEYTGYLDYNKELDVYQITPCDSNDRKYSLIDFKRHPHVSIINSWNLSTFIIVFYVGVWVFLMLLAAVIVLSERKDKGKKVFEE